ncbi:signal peptidase I [Candidatus Berkelbacteria bacterium]|nr:signal peptidase I [Candidatus Berkelbacteria bacterium]
MHSPNAFPNLNSQAPVALPETNLGERILGSEKLYKRLSYGFELLRGVLILVILTTLVHLFVATVFRISGESMLPNFQDGQFILIDRISYNLHPPTRGDVIVLRFPGDANRRKFIKRIVGMPGEKIEIKQGKVFANDVPLVEYYLPADFMSYPDLVKVLRSDEVFVMGDNRPNSNDSRFFGPLPMDRIIGKSQAILSGKAFGWIAQPAF